MKDKMTLYFAYLDRLRDIGAANMYDAVVPLMSRFGLSVEEAQSVLKGWMIREGDQANHSIDVGKFLDAVFGKKGRP